MSPAREKWLPSAVEAAAIEEEPTQGGSRKSEITFDQVRTVDKVGTFDKMGTFT